MKPKRIKTYYLLSFPVCDYNSPCLYGSEIPRRWETIEVEFTKKGRNVPMPEEIRMALENEGFDIKKVDVVDNPTCGQLFELLYEAQKNGKTILPIPLNPQTGGVEIIYHSVSSVKKKE